MLNLFFPHLCCGCDRRLLDGSMVLCVNCRSRLAICFPKNLNSNSFTKRFYGRLRLESGFSLLRFEPSNLCRDLIHQLKYKGKQQLGEFFGLWMASQLSDHTQKLQYDGIVPVPLSSARLRKRGYNQVDRFAEALGAALAVPVIKGGLIRTDKAKSSVSMGRSNRFEHTHTFEKSSKLQLEPGQHLLIVDDTITTGATLEACAKVLLNQASIRLSFATIAMTE